MPAAWTRPKEEPKYYWEEIGSSRADGACLEGYNGHRIQIYTDGSGGHNMAVQRLRRCRWTWIVNKYKWGVAPSFVAHYGQRGTMRDTGPEAQTVPKAELEAIYHALRALETAPWIIDLLIYSDCKAVVDGFAKGRDATLMGDMGTLWYDVWAFHARLVESGIRKIRVVEVKGHCGDPVLTPITHQKGNWCADFHAGAAVAEVPEAEAREIRERDKELWAIQERLIDILCMQPDRTIDPSEETIRQVKITHKDKAMEKGHMVEKCRGALLLHEMWTELET